MDLDKIVKEKWTSPFRKQFVYVDGFMLTKKYLDTKYEYDNFEVRDEDIWISTFPKCGTTWAQEMIWLIANNLDFEEAKNNLDNRFPFFELSTLVNLNVLKEKNPSFKVSPFVENSLKVIKNQKNPRFIKTHFSFPLFPKQIQNSDKKPKIIYVVRDPRDVCVSFYHHSLLIDGFSVTFDEYCELFLAGKVPYGPYWNHVFAFWKIRHQPNILIIKYEDMKKDLKKTIIQVGNFLNRCLSDDQIEKLSQHLSFDSMKYNQSVNKDELLKFFQNFMDKPNNEGCFIRKGIIGDYKSKMSSEMIKKFDEWIQKNIQGTDYVL